MTPRNVLVKDLGVLCSLKIMNFNSPGHFMSECCQKSAEFVVNMSDGSYQYRCYEHKSVREAGPYSRTVLVDCPA